MALADVFKQTTFDPAEYEMQLNYNRLLQQQRAIAAQKADQERTNFLQQQRGREEIESSIRGDWYTDKAIQAAEQSYQQPLTTPPPMQPMSQPLGAAGPPPVNIMPQAPPMSMAPQGQAPPMMGLEAPQGQAPPGAPPMAPPPQMGQPPRRPSVPRPPGGFQTLEGFTWAQQQEDRQQKLNDAKAAKIMEVFGKPGVQENPDLAKKVGSWLAQVPGYEEMAAAIQDAEFGKPGQKIVFGMQLKNLPPEEKAAIGELSEEDRANINPTDKFTLKQVGGKWMLTDFKPSVTGKNTIVKTIVRNGKPVEVLFDRTTGEEIKELGEGKAGGTTGRYVASADEVTQWANAVRAGRVTIDKVPAYGGLRAKVIPEVEKATANKEPIHYTGDIAAAKSASTSQSFVTKQLDMSQSFITTIDANIDQLKEHIQDMATRKNTDYGKLMNMGVRTYLKSIEGDSDINIYDMLVNAISTETARLVSGGAGSVAQVAEGARIEMDKIHNKDMPIKEMLKLLEATRREGANRISALEKQLGTATQRTRTTRPISKPGAPVQAGAPVASEKAVPGKFVGKDKRNGRNVYSAGGKYYYEDGSEVK